MLSIIIPAYNEQDNILVICEEITKTLEKENIDFELIFINDGSTDLTWHNLKKASSIYKNLTAINFSRNFGKESAIFCGLKKAKGDACILMDCDLQHPPKTIIQMYNLWKNNDIDIVEAVKADRGTESFIYKFFANFFYEIISKASNLNMRNASDFKLLDRKVIDSLNEMPERLTFFRAMSSWVGFKKEQIEFEVAQRQHGQTTWTLFSLFKYALNSITSFTSAPMQIVTMFGLILFIASLFLGANTFYSWLVGSSLEGFPTVILLQLISSSIIMFSLGLIGYYIAKIYEEIKARPRYLIQEEINSNDDIT